jgi:hypothetical protein
MHNILCLKSGSSVSGFGSSAPALGARAEPKPKKQELRRPCLKLSFPLSNTVDLTKAEISSFQDYGIFSVQIQ